MEALFHYLEQSKPPVDPSLLYFLQLDPFKTSHHASINELRALCERLDLCSQFSSNTTPLFHSTVASYIKVRGEVFSITPHMFVTARKKRDAIEKYHEVKESWGIHNPFFFQTYSVETDPAIIAERGPYKDIVYFITRTWMDGIIRYHEMLSQRFFVLNDPRHQSSSNLTSHEILGAWEHVLDQKETLYYAIFDCEQKASAYGGTRSNMDLNKTVQKFPEWINRELGDLGCISKDDTVRYELKEKSRNIILNDETGEAIIVDYKASRHIVPSIIGTHGEHQAAQKKVLNKYREYLDKVKAAAAASAGTDSAGVIPEDMRFGCKHVKAIILFWDSGAGLNNGIAMMGSRKKASEPLPQYVGYVDVQDRTSTMNGFESCSDTLGEYKNLLVETAKLCYTIPKKYMVPYTTTTSAGLEVGGGGLGGSPSSSPLPPQDLARTVGRKRAYDGSPPTYIVTTTPAGVKIAHAYVSLGLEVANPDEWSHARTQQEVRSLLPDWFLTFFEDKTKNPITFNTISPVVDTFREMLPQCVQERAVLFYVQRGWCARSMADAKVEIHTSNHMILAYVKYPASDMVPCTGIAADSGLTKDEIFLTCITGLHRINYHEASAIDIVHMFSVRDDATGKWSRCDKKDPPTAGKTWSTKKKAVRWVLLCERSAALLDEEVKRKKKEINDAAKAAMMKKRDEEEEGKK